MCAKRRHSVASLWYSSALDTEPSRAGPFSNAAMRHWFQFSASVNSVNSVVFCCVAATILLSKVSTKGTRFRSPPVEPRECGGRVMLRNLSEEICECYRHAEDCARKAAGQSCQKLRQDFLDLEQRWLSLARSYEFTERLTDFSDETKRISDKLPRLGG